MANEAAVLGIDAGTGGVRAGIFDLRGTPLGAADASYDTRYPQAGWAVQRPADWWTALCAAVRGALAAADVPGDRIIGLAVDAPCDILLAAADGTPLTEALMWMDLRGTADARRMSATHAPILRFCGDDVPAEWPWPKALWLRANERATWDRAPRLVEQMTWLTWKLTGEWVAPLNSAAAKWQYRASAGADAGWPVALLRQLDALDAIDKLPARIVPMGGVGGELDRASAAALGLRAGTPVAMTGIDAHVGMVGVDTLAPGTLALITGTSTCQLAQSARPIFDPGLWGPFENAVLPGEWTIEAGQASTGGTVRWLMDLAGDRWSGPDRYRAADAEAAASGVGADGLCILDYWQGSRTPVKDPAARGTIWGLTTGHTPGDLLRAVYEATAYGNRRILDALAAGGVRTERIVACGGGVRSDLWMQIIADVAGVPITLTDNPDAVSLGAAIVAAVGAGAFADLRVAAGAMVHPARVVEPNPALRGAYAAGFDRYVRTYEALAPLFAHGG